MKNLFLIAALIVSVNAHAADVVTIEQVTEKVKKENYTLLANAERVYQAKVSIEEARGKLLPSLNLWKLAAIIIDPTSILDNIPEIAPFLVPANWYVLKERELLFYAEKEGYRALQGNELNSARSLYFKTLFDEHLLRLLDIYTSELDELLTIAESRVTLGIERAEVAREIEIRLLSIQEDKRNVSLLVQEERNLISYMMGLPAETEVSLSDIVLPDISKIDKISYDNLVGRALLISPEKRQYEHFLKVIPLIKKEQKFAFLGGSSFSRGVAGGIFDNLPSTNGLGFGTGPALRIIDSEGRVLALQKKGIIETLKRQLKSVVATYNTSIDINPSQVRRFNLSKENVAQLRDRIILGEKINLFEYANAIHTKNIANTAWLDIGYKFQMTKDKLDRLLFWNNYDMPPVEIERIKP